MVWDKSKYILQANTYDFKFKSLEDNVYFTLRDIFLNISTEFKMYEANDLNSQISKGVAFEDRTEDFSYVKLESNGDLVSGILKFFNSIKESEFEYEINKSEADKKTDDPDYIDFNVWWKHFTELKITLSKLKIKID